MRANRTKIATCGLTELTEKKAGEESHKTEKNSTPRGGAISQPICTKFGEFVDLTDLITPVKFGSKIFIGFFQAERWKKPFSLLGPKQTAYIVLTME